MPVSAEQHRASVGSNNSARARVAGKLLAGRKNLGKNFLEGFVISLLTVHVTDEGKR